MESAREREREKGEWKDEIKKEGKRGEGKRGEGKKRKGKEEDGNSLELRREGRAEGWGDERKQKNRCEFCF